MPNRYLPYVPACCTLLGELLEQPHRAALTDVPAALACRDFCVKVLRACLPSPQRPAHTVVSYELALLARRGQAQGVAAAEAKKRYGLSDSCVRSLPLAQVLAENSFQLKG